GLLVEDLPGEHARLLQDFAAVFGVGIAVEVEDLFDKPLPARGDDDAERVAVLLKAVADIEIADRRRVEVPGAGMRARPMPGRRRPEIERHLETLPGVVARAAHLREVPAGAQI